jgi:hypothetical protein
MEAGADEGLCFRCAVSDEALPPIPFERRSELGLWTATWETLKGAMMEPTNFWRSHLSPSDNTAPLIFVALLLIPILVGSFTGAAINALMVGPLESLLGRADLPLPPEAIDEILKGMRFTPGTVIKILLTVPPVVFIMLFIQAAISHLFLILLGGASKDLSSTWRMTCYATAARVLDFIPGLGRPVASIWVLASRVIAYREDHECSTGQAVGAVLLPVVVFLCCCGLLAGLGIAAVIKAAEQGAL